MNISPQRDTSLHVLIVGCGGIGGVIACTFAQAGLNLTIATTNVAVRNIWQTARPQLNGRPIDTTQNSVHVVAHAKETDGLFDLVFVAVQPNQIEEVGASLEHKLTTNGRVVCLPNGLCESRLANYVGSERVVGAVVAWGARMPNPGEYLRTSSGGFLVGALRSTADKQIPLIVELLKLVGPVRTTNNLQGARFSKLVINCAVSALGTIGGSSLGQLLVQAPVRSLALSLMAEAIAVGLAEGIKLESVTRIDLAKLVAKKHSERKIRQAAQHAILLMVGARYRNLRSSMLAAIEKGREPAIDFINGEIVALGRKQNTPVPLNEAATRIIWSIAHGQLEPGPDALALLSNAAFLNENS